MIPIKLMKEQPGYVLNTLLVPLLSAAQMLLAKGVADIETIDKTWMLATKAPFGPFGILDIVGLKTAYDIASMQAQTDPDYEVLAKMIKTIISIKVRWVLRLAKDSISIQTQNTCI